MARTRSWPGATPVRVTSWSGAWPGRARSLPGVRGLLAGADAGPSSILAGGDAEPSSLLAGIAKMSLQLTGAMPGASASRQSAPLVSTPALLWRKTRGKEGPPGTMPMICPRGIDLKDGALFATLSAKIQGKYVGIPICEGAAMSKSPWDEPDLFDLYIFEGESIRECFFDKPRRAFDSGNRNP